MSGARRSSDKMDAALLPFVDSVRTVVRKNDHAFVIEIDKGEMMKELEAE